MVDSKYTKKHCIVSRDFETHSLKWAPCLTGVGSEAWSAWTDTGATRNQVNTCTNCPAPSTQTQTQWVGASAACPAGQVGSYTWEAEQSQTRTLSYNCPAGTSTLPPATVGGWSAWANTGATRNAVNTCAPPAVTCTAATRHFRSVNIPGLSNHFGVSQPPAGNPANTGPSVLPCDASREGLRAVQVITSSGGGLGGVAGGGSILGLLCTGGTWYVQGYGGNATTLAWFSSSPEWQALFNQAQADQGSTGTGNFYTHYQCQN